jgi:hypothetical protein
MRKSNLPTEVDEEIHPLENVTNFDEYSQLKPPGKKKT